MSRVGSNSLVERGSESRPEMGCMVLASPSQHIGQLQTEGFDLKLWGQCDYGNKPSSVVVNMGLLLECRTAPQGALWKDSCRRALPLPWNTAHCIFALTLSPTGQKHANQMRCEETGDSGALPGGRAGVDGLAGPGVVAPYHVTSGLVQPMVYDSGCCLRVQSVSRKGAGVNVSCRGGTGSWGVGSPLPKSMVRNTTPAGSSLLMAVRFASFTPPFCQVLATKALAPIVPFTGFCWCVYCWYLSS